MVSMVELATQFLTIADNVDTIKSLAVVGTASARSGPNV